MRGERARRQVRLDDPAEVMVDAGLVDVDYVAAQLGTSVRLPARRGARGRARRRRVAAPALRGAVDRPPPLVAARWASTPCSGTSPSAGGATASRPTRWSTRASSSPPTPRPATTPTARCRTGSSVSGPGAPLPTRILPRRVSWGTYRAAAIEAAAGWREEVVRERPAAGRARRRPARSRTTSSPAVTVVMAAQDAGPLVHAHGGLAPGADLRRLAPRRGRPRLARRHRRGAAGHGRLRRPHHRGPRVALRPRPRPQRRARARHRPSTSRSCRSGASGCPRCSTTCSPTPHAHRGRLRPGRHRRGRALAARAARSGARSTSPRRCCGARPSRTSAASTSRSAGVGRARPGAAAHARPPSRWRSTYRSCRRPDADADRASPTTGTPSSSSASSSTGTPPRPGRRPRTWSAT